MLSYKQLTTPVTEEKALETILDNLSSVGFSATSWQSGSIQYTFWRFIAKLYAGFTNYASDVTKSGFAKQASGDYQDALGVYSFDLPRVAALTTQGTVRVSLAADATAASWGEGELQFADAPSAPANSFRITEAGSLLPGEFVDIDAECETAGAAGNIAPNTTLYFWTPIEGLTVTNPAISGSSTWVTRNGQEEEKQARYAERMVGRWSRLSYGNIEGAYKAWALEALPELTRVTVREGPNDGEVIVTGATETGTITEEQIQIIADYINGVTDGVGRRPINDILIVQSATALSTPAVEITVVCESAYASDADDRVSLALSDLFGSLPIGGEINPPDTTGKVYTSRMYQAVMGQTGIKNVTGLPSDVSLTIDQIYTPAITVTVISL